MSAAAPAGRLAVDLVTCDGQRTSGWLLLRPHGQDHETLGDRLNDATERFLSCEIEGRSELIRRSWVACVSHAGALPEVEDRLAAGAGREPVELELMGGCHLRGELLHMLPSTRRRVMDLVNAPGVAFLLMISGSESIYVNRASVVRVRV